MVPVAYDVRAPSRRALTIRDRCASSACGGGRARSRGPRRPPSVRSLSRRSVAPASRGSYRSSSSRRSGPDRERQHGRASHGRLRARDLAGGDPFSGPDAAHSGFTLFIPPGYPKVGDSAIYARDDRTAERRGPDRGGPDRGRLDRGGPERRGPDRRGPERGWRDLTGATASTPAVDGNRSVRIVHYRAIDVTSSSRWRRVERDHIAMPARAISDAQYPLPAPISTARRAAPAIAKIALSVGTTHE